jgi:hypothetical protein
MNVIKQSNSPIQVKITETGTCIAKLKHVWQATRRYDKRNAYKIVKSYGVEGIAPF